jgi:hypothetical protein
MRRLLTLALAAALFTPLCAQQPFDSGLPSLAQGQQDSKERAAEILKKIEQAIQQESERSRAELLDLVRQELRGNRSEPKAADPTPEAKKAPAGSTEKAKAVLTTDLLKKHAGYLASDELEGRCAGYPGCDKAADYIAESFKKPPRRAAMPGLVPEVPLVGRTRRT